MVCKYQLASKITRPTDYSLDIFVEIITKIFAYDSNISFNGCSNPYYKLSIL